MQITHTQKEFKDFEIKYLGEYHDLFIQSDTILLADVFENLRNMCINIYKLDPAKFLSTPGLEWQAAIKIAKVKLGLLPDIDILLMVKKVLEEEYVPLFIYQYAKTNYKCIKNYDQNK